MQIKHSRRVRSLTALPLAVFGLVSGCGYQTHGDQQGSEAASEAIADRAHQVAEAWDGSRAAKAWNAGFHPMSDVTQPPRGGFRNVADGQAYREKNLLLQAELPATWPKTGQVAWAGGGRLTRPLTSPKKAFGDMTGGNTGGEPHLTVTHVELGEMTITTGRGPATVPAWTFSLKGYKSPLKRAAAQPSALPAPPIKGAPDVPVTRLHHLVRMNPNDSSISVITFHSICEESSAVKALETKDSVVLSATSLQKKGGGACTKEAKLQQVTVKLRRPVGQRLLLDSRTGLPVPYRLKTDPHPAGVEQQARGTTSHARPVPLTGGGPA
jgi:hypothetical protein